MISYRTLPCLTCHDGHQVEDSFLPHADDDLATVRYARTVAKQRAGAGEVGGCAAEVGEGDTR